MNDTFNKLYYLFNKTERLQLGILFLLILAGAVIETSAVALIAPFVAVLNSPEIVLKQGFLQTIYYQLGADSPRQFLLWATFALIIFYCTKGLYFSLLNYTQIRFFNSKQVNISKQLLQSYLDRPYIFHLQHNSADLIRNTNGEVATIFAGVISPSLALLSEIIVTIFITLILIIFEPISSAIAALVLFVAIFIFNQVIRKQVSKQGLIRQQKSGKVIQCVTQALGGIKETKILGREHFFLETYTKQNQELNQANLFLNLANQLPPLFVETIVMVSLLLILVFTLIQGKEISSILQTISLFAISALRLMPSIKRMLGSITTIRYFQSSVDIVYQDIFSLKKVQTQFYLSVSEVSTPVHFNHSIQLQNIDYQYPNSKNRSIKNVSLLIPKGHSVGFVGSTGAGKTTIIDIILGLLTPSKGQVTVDGQDIQNNLRGWQKHIGYIPQSIYLSDDTIRANIAFGIANDEIIEERVWLALEAAQLKQLVCELPAHLDTVIGERGIRLSGGQRQRIGIARALYHNPDVLVMDEATAALDNNTEREFMQALEAMSRKKTIIMIAHRLSTVKNCDCLYLMNQGEIICSGTYSDLISQSKEFQSLAYSEPSYNGI